VTFSPIITVSPTRLVRINISLLLRRYRVYCIPKPAAFLCTVVSLNTADLFYFRTILSPLTRFDIRIVTDFF